MPWMTTSHTMWRTWWQRLVLTHLRPQVNHHWTLSTLLTSLIGAWTASPTLCSSLTVISSPFWISLLHQHHPEAEVVTPTISWISDDLTGRPVCLTICLTHQCSGEMVLNCTGVPKGTVILFSSPCTPLSSSPSQGRAPCRTSLMAAVVGVFRVDRRSTEYR